MSIALWLAWVTLVIVAFSIGVCHGRATRSSETIFVPRYPTAEEMTELLGEGDVVDEKE